MRPKWTIFQDDEAGFQLWMDKHPKGFVLNARRRRTHPTCIIHRSGCSHLRSVRNNPDVGALTGPPVMKVCAPGIDELLQFVMHDRSARMVLVKRCRTCDAIRSDIRVEPVREEREPAMRTERHTTLVPVNVYERNPEAIAICLAHYGAACRVCAMDFRRRYGALGEGFMQVHHLVHLKADTADYVLDPINDLVPVCPNCHAMLHRGTERPRTVEQLRRLLEMARKHHAGNNGWVERMEQEG
jgi:hypothetical protein